MRKSLGIADLLELAERAKTPPEDAHLYYITDGFQGSSYSPYYSFLFYLCQDFWPKSTLELGTEQGRATAFIASGWRGGHVHTVEINFGWNPWRRHFGCFPLVQVHLGSTVGEDYETKRPMHEIFNENDFDIIFLDSSHHLEETFKEWELYWPKLSPGGIWCFDDRMAEGPRALWPTIHYPKVALDELHSSGGFAAVIKPG